MTMVHNFNLFRKKGKRNTYVEFLQLDRSHGSNTAKARGLGNPWDMSRANACLIVDPRCSCTYGFEFQRWWTCDMAILRNVSTNDRNSVYLLSCANVFQRSKRRIKSLNKSLWINFNKAHWVCWRSKQNEKRQSYLTTLINDKEC